MKFKNRITILLVISLFVTSSLFLIPGTRTLGSEEDENLFLLTERTDEEVEIETRMIFDDFGNFHFFTEITYDNDTFKIIHIVNDETKVVIIDRYPLDFFEVFVVEGGIALIYSFRAFYDITFFRMYTWTPEDGGTDFQIYEYNSRANYPHIRIFQDGPRHFDMFLTFIDNFPPTSENADTEYQHYKIYRDNVTNLWYTDAEVRKVWVAEEEFDYMMEMYYKDGMVYTGYQYIFSGVPEHFYITTVANATTGVSNITNVMVLNEGGFDPRFFVTEDGVFNLALARNSILYTLRYGVNDTPTFENFTQTYIGIFDYDSFTFQEKDGYTEYIFSSVPYLEYDEFFGGEKLKSTITIIRDNYTGIYETDQFDIYNVPKNTNLFSFSQLETTTGERIFVHSTSIQKEDVQGAKLTHENLIGYFVSTTVDLGEFSNLHVSQISILSPWYILWYSAGIYIVVIGGFLGIMLVIFRKRVKVMYVNLKEFLNRPFSKSKSKFILAFANIWYWIFNSFSAIYTLFKTNKKRHMMNLVGMTVFAIIIITSTTVFSSKQDVLLDDYSSRIDLLNSGTPSMTLSLNYDTAGFGSRNPLLHNFEKLAIGEVLTEFYMNYPNLASIISGFEYISAFYVTIDNPEFNATDYFTVNYLCLSENYSTPISNFLVAGRMPETKGEALVSSDFLTTEYLELDLNDNFTLWGSQINYYNSEPGDTNVSLKIVGVYQTPSTADFTEIWNEYNLPLDSLSDLSGYYANIVSFGDLAWENLAGLYPYYMFVSTSVQFKYDFSNISPNQLSQLSQENDELKGRQDTQFSFEPIYRNSKWDYSGELYLMLDILEPRLNSSIFLFFTLAMPIIYIAMFLISETNELYTQSLEQEIDIFQSKGVKSTRIATNYISLKIVESILAVGIGFGISMALSPALLRVDSFISFNSPHTSLQFGGVGVAIAFTVIGLVFIATPKIWKMSKTKRIRFQKTPQRISSLFKQIRLPPVLLVVGGGGVAWGSLALFQLLYANIGEAASVSILMVFIYLAGFGVLLVFLGLGLLLKDLFSIFMIALSKVSWNIRKSLGTFSLIEIRSDIKLFKNIYLAFLLIVGITLPSIISPTSMQMNFEKDVYFYNGADLYINNWMNLNVTEVVPLVRNITGVESTALVREIEGAMVDYDVIQVYLIQNTTEYLATSYKPPLRMFDDWENKVAELNTNKSMLTTFAFNRDFAEFEDSFRFSSTVPLIEVTYNIIGEFEYLPIFYTVGEYIPGESPKIPALFMTESNYATIKPIIHPSPSGENVNDRLLIKVSKRFDHVEVKDQIEQVLGLRVRCAVEEIEELKFESFPFFNIIAAEFVLSVLICLVAIVYISISNPLKILQQRTNKNDRLKKMGISTKRIIQLTMSETFFAGVLPGMVMGTGAGFGLIALFILVIKNYFYSGINFLIDFNIAALIIAYVVAPALFMSIFYFSMKANYAKYMPRNLE
ncbi:MAG: ABC transporter permease [Candidatus Heimdallarchaeota archaeon]|nr:ABC transporter permease [Candidatus Heimdallarchaeota archaeon]